MGENSKVVVELTGESADLKQELEKSEGFVKKFGSVVKATMIAVGGAIAVGAIVSAGKEFVDIAAQQERANTRLNSVLEATGHAAGFSSDKLGEMAAAMHDMTGISKDVLKDSYAIIATFKNVRGDQFKETAMLAADMAEVLQSDVKGAAMQVAKALNDPIKGVSALADAGVSFTQQQQDMIAKMVEANDIVGAQKVILEELRGEFGGAAEAAGGTFSGQMAKMSETIRDVKGNIGEGLMPVLMEFMPLIEGLGEFVKNNSEVFKMWGKTLAQYISIGVGQFKQLFDFVVEVGVGTFTMFQVAIENWKDYAILAVSTYALAVVKHFETVKYILTEVLPTTLKWFADNWTSIFIDIGNFYKTVLDNMLDNAFKFGQALISYLQGDGFNFEWTGLTDGFKATLSELPEYAERTKSELEKSLESTMAESGARIGMAFEKRFKENMDAVKGLFRSERQELDNITADLDVQKADIASASKDKASKEKDKGSQSLAGSIEALQGLQQRISEAAASNNDPALDESKKQSSLLTDANSELRNMTGLLQDIRDRPGAVVLQ